MDNSIADILASVTRAHEATVAAASGLPLPSEQQQQQVDLQQLTRAWIAERMAPEILPYPAELMGRIMARLSAQRRPDRKIESIEDRTARMDAGTSFTLVIMQTELERFKFLVRSLLRTRIAKIDAYPTHLLSLPPSQSASLLSPTESQYLTTHASLLSNHYTTSFLSSFPPKLRRLDDRAGAGGVGMVEGPDLEKPVFVRCLGVAEEGTGGPRVRGRGGYGAGLDSDDDDDEDAGDTGTKWGEVEVSCGFTGAAEDDEDATMRGAGGGGGERVVKMKRGEVWMMRWSAVREAFARGEVELI